MEKTCKILIITVPSWNSKVGANSWSTLLEAYDSDCLASIYIRDEYPDSKVCSRYFNISENKVLKSLFSRRIQTGTEINANDSEVCNEDNLRAHNIRYQKMGKKRRYLLLMAREIIWKIGRWRTPELDDFLDDFQPDVILHSMDGYIHLNRITEYAIKRTGAKAVGYIWDDNFTYKQSDKIGYKIYRYFQRQSLKKLAKLTNAFFAISDLTKKEADEFFNINCHLLTKPINTTPVVEYGKISKPIKLLYTGRFYIGRDKSLLKVLKAIEALPEKSFFVDVYTNTQLDYDYLANINPLICRIHKAIPQENAIKKQKEADVLLFLEDIDGPDARAARLSFSTKTTDYLSSGRCIFAIGNKDTAPMQYFIKNKAAFTACTDEEILDVLKRIAASPELMIECARNAAAVGIKNHNKEEIQKVFDSVIQNL